MIDPVGRVAVIGAGVAGVVTAAHLLAEGLDVTIFERAAVAGGVWVFDPRIPREPAYPSVKAKATYHDDTGDDDDPYLLHSPPGAAYETLTNNVGTHLLEISLNKWKPDTPTFVRHHVLAEYIQDTSAKTGVHERTVYNTDVKHARKDGSIWRVETATWDAATKKTTANTWVCPQYPRVWVYSDGSRAFDAVVVASGHYHVPRIPEIPGLATWKRAWLSRVQHSKSYRNPTGFDNQTVLLIGGSASSFDIAKELGPITKKIWQSTRNGTMDAPDTWLPPNGTRVGQVASFGPLDDDHHSQSEPSAHIPGKVTLVDGTVLEDIDRVIIATGYHFTLPFLPPEYHGEDIPREQADDQILVSDGTMLHNLHRDIFYIPDPTLVFTGVPFYTATFSLFEFQAIAIAALFSGQATLPSEPEMRAEYAAKVLEKGHGKPFHTLVGQDVEYAAGLMEWVNRGRDPSRRKPAGYTREWVEARDAFMKQYFGRAGSKENEESSSS